MTLTCQLCKAYIDRWSPNEQFCSLQCVVESRVANAKALKLQDKAKKVLEAQTA